MSRLSLWLLFAIALAALSSAAGGSPGTLSMACTPRRHIPRSRGAGRQGHQVCRDDGASYGMCTGCDDAGMIVSRPDSGDTVGDASPSTDAVDTSSSDTGRSVMDTGVPDIGVPDAGVPAVDVPAV